MDNREELNSLFQPTFGNRPVQYIGRDSMIQQFTSPNGPMTALNGALFLGSISFITAFPLHIDKFRRRDLCATILTGRVKSKSSIHPTCSLEDNRM